MATRAKNDPVIWKDIYELAKLLDINFEGNQAAEVALSEKLHTTTTSTDVRPDLQYGYSSVEPVLVNLSTDETTPFCIKQLGIHGGKEIEIFQRYEFAYYNYKRDSSEPTQYVFAECNHPSYKNKTKRYYEDNTRLPILHSMFLTKDFNTEETITFNDLIPKDCFDEDYKSLHKDTESEDVVYHLIENRLKDLYKWWPKPKCYYADIVSPDLYLQIQANNGCVYIPRICPVVSMEGCVSNNSNNNTYGFAKCLPFSPNYDTEAFTALRKKYFKDWMTLHNITYDVYTSEVIQQEPETDDWHAPYPPICPTCSPITFPKIGLEGGQKKPKEDEFAENSFGDDVESNIYSLSVLQSKAMWANPGKEHLPVDEEGNPKEGYVYGVDWVWAEEIDKYESVSTYVAYQSAFADYTVRYTPLRFMAGDDYRYNLIDPEKLEKDVKCERQDCVIVPTALVIKLKGYITTPIRKRWYDMIFYKIKSILGYWYNKDLSCHSTEHLINSIPDKPDELPIIGTTWNYEKEKEYEQVQKPCSRWIASNLAWKSSNKEGSKVMSKSADGNFYIEQYLAYLANKDKDKDQYTHFGQLNLDILEKEEDTCKDFLFKDTLVTPWNGGVPKTPNGVCDLTSYMTHWNTLVLLHKIIQDINAYKIKENNTAGLAVPVNDWQYCAPEFEQGTDDNIEVYESTLTSEDYYFDEYSEYYATDSIIWKEVVTLKYNYIAGDCVNIETTEESETDKSDSESATGENEGDAQPTITVYDISVKDCEGSFSVAADLTLGLSVNKDAGTYRYDAISGYGACYCINPDGTLKFTPGVHKFNGAVCPDCAQTELTKQLNSTITYSDVDSIVTTVKSNEEATLPEYYSTQKQNHSFREVSRDVVNKIIYYEDSCDVLVSVDKEKLTQIVWGSMGYVNNLEQDTVIGAVTNNPGIEVPTVTAQINQFTITQQPDKSISNDIIVGSIDATQQQFEIPITGSGTFEHGPHNQHVRSDVSIDGKIVYMWEFTNGSRSIVNDIELANVTYNYDNVTMSEAFNYSVQTLQDTSTQWIVVPEECKNWVEVTEPGDDVYKYWCRVHAILYTYNPTGKYTEIPFQVFKELDDSCDTVSVKHYLTAIKKVERNNLITEAAWRTINEQYLLELDPNQYNNSGSKRGLYTATYWCTYLLPVNTPSTIKLKFESPLKRGAVKKGQYKLKVPGENCMDAIATCPTAPSSGSYKTYGANCNSNDADCTYITECNEGGALMIKPWIVHKNVVTGDIIELKGQGSICRDDSFQLQPLDYVNQSGQTGEYEFVVNPGFSSRVTIGFTCLLNSWANDYIFESNNLENYMFQPSIEYVKMSLTIS